MSNDGFKEVEDFTGAETIRLGGRDKKTGKANPTKVEGYYLGTKTGIKSKFGPSSLHFFQTENGVIGVWGKTDMDRKVSQATPGQLTRVEFTGKTVPSKKGNDMQIYKVSLHPTDFISVSEGTTAALNESNEDSSSGEYEEANANEAAYEEADEDSIDDEPTYEDEVTPVRPSAPVRQVTQTNPARVNAMLKNRPAKTSGQ